MHILTPFPKELLLLVGSLSRPIKADIVKEHLTRTSGDRYVALGSQANRYTVDVGQDYALIFEEL